ncbi:MAG: hypothetical protein LBK67_13565 [Coriobacteriales bacterium]|jgi:hypothetical protein|nr:hypothetical protein [Coriobacteriales bacterium]
MGKRTKNEDTAVVSKTSIPPTTFDTVAAVAVAVDAVADAKKDESFEGDDTSPKTEAVLKKRRDVRDGLLVLVVLIAIIAAPAVGAAVQAREQSDAVVAAAEKPSEAESTQTMPVAEKTTSLVPLAVNAVKDGDTVLAGTGNPDFVVRVVFVGQGSPSETTVGKDNTWKITVPSGVSLKAGDEKVLDITQNDPQTSASYRPGATAPSMPGTQDDTVVAENSEATTGASDDPHAGQVWHEGWNEQVLVQAAYSEQVQASAAWTEQVSHPAEYTTVYHDAEYTTVYHEGYWE